MSLKKSVDSGMVTDAANHVAGPVAGLLTGLSAMRTLVTEILSMTSSQAAEPRDAAYIAAVESRVRNMLATMQEPRETAPAR